MNSYMSQLPVWETYNGAYSGGFKKEINFDRLEQFKDAIEDHVQRLTTEVQTLKAHANWIEPRLNDYHKFMEWMQRVHPDVITAYTQATKVEETLDKANGEEQMVYAESSS